VFGPRWWGHGYATEATNWLIRELAGQGIAALWAAVHPANAASKSLLARTGFLATGEPRHGMASFDPGDDVYVRPMRARSKSGSGT
jgi:RimJ/RimL family protein N-acetyltransferase